MQGLRKIGRTISIAGLILIGLFLIGTGFGANAPAMQTLIGAGALFGAFGLIATWFWPTS